MTEDIAALKAKLAQPHRIRSSRVLFAACRDALAYIDKLEAEKDAPKRRGRPPKVIADPQEDL